jgi:hypothetical protein
MVIDTSPLDAMFNDEPEQGNSRPQLKPTTSG